MQPELCFSKPLGSCFGVVISHQGDLLGREGLQSVYIDHPLDIDGICRARHNVDAHTDQPQIQHRGYVSGSLSSYALQDRLDRSACWMFEDGLH